MRPVILLSFFVFLAAGAACAQHRGGAGAGFAGGGYGFSHARNFSPRFGPARPRPRLGYANLPYGSGYANPAYGYGYASLPYDSGDAYLNDDSGAAYAPYDTGAMYPYPPGPAAQPPAPAAQPPAPAAEPHGHSVITEYNWPAASPASSASSAAAESEPQNFAIVLKNGSTLSAISVFASDNSLHYVDPDERHLRIDMSQVDRAATLKVNRARNLNLYLPAAD